MERPEFRDGDVVMICSHLYKRATLGHDISWKLVTVAGRFEPRRGFIREDGTDGASDFHVSCGRCAGRRDADYVEELYRHGQFHVADFCRRAS